jgi:hypothetical protein
LREGHIGTIDLGGHSPRSNVAQRCKWALGLLVLGLFALQPTASHSQEAIGSAASVKPQAEANTRMLSGGSTVYSKELIHTGDAGVADLRFHENTNLSVGPYRGATEPIILGRRGGSRHPRW